jgi:hypothetical protein
MSAHVSRPRVTPARDGRVASILNVTFGASLRQNSM